MQIDLCEEGVPVQASVVDVAMFKEPTNRTRVVAESQQFVVYSLKNPATLRVLSRGTGGQGTFKLHKNEVELAKFVNYKSSVIATAAKDEFFVWFINVTGDVVETYKYFSIQDQVTIRSVSWFIDSKSRTPDMLVLYGSAAQLSSSRIIKDYTRGAEVEVPLKDITIPFEHAVSQDASLTAVGADGVFAFTVDSVSVAACWARRGSSTFRPCDGETLVGLELLNDKPATLAAACDAFVAVWSIEGEPSRLYKLSVGSPIVMLASVLNTFAIFSSNKELYLVDVANKQISNTTRHGLKYQVAGGSRSNVVNATEGGVSCISDFGQRLALHYVKHSFTSSGVSAAPAPLPPPRSQVPSVAASVQKMVDPAIISATPGAMMAPPPPAYVASSVAAPMAMGGSGTTPILAPPQQRSVLVANPTLPQVSQDGLIAQALQTTLSAHNQTKQSLSSVIDNTFGVLQIGPQVLKRDHSNLVTLSLEAQMTELQNIVKSGEISIGGGASSSQSGSGSNGFESQLLSTMTEDIAKRLAEGIVPGLREALLSDLEPQMRTAVANMLKKSQKDTFKTRVDAVLKNIASEFVAELERKQANYQKQFVDYGKEVRKASETSMQRLLQQLDATERELQSIQSSGILEELRALRQEVKDLREIAAQAGQRTLASSELSPATAIETAKQFIQSNEVQHGLSYIVRMNRPETTIALFEELKSMADVHDALLEMKNDTLWGDILLHESSVRVSDNLPSAVFWIKSILAEHPGSVKAPAVKTAISSFVANWKKETLPAAVVTELNSIQKYLK
eukprot:CAMPEP_0176456940 /NCGR_PEP_ID=MMETSP0127-20121128/31609_1 /TAXON_ID=938130 /ORGANISM="Platyophrya macrostoma, Strain WH" /LENGTH=791 /DNA_ID=CAMNT_0017847039 /DNA_START=6 /DNA_END=2381 /DNA_ORIENTATION=-